MLKVLVTGGNQGIGRDIVEYFSPHAKSLSRTNDFDIRDPQARKKIVELSLDCDIFMNHAYARDNSQTDLLRELFQAWVDQKKKGYIFNTGTYGTYNSQGIDADYIRLKAQLDEVHFECCKKIKSDSLPFRMTLIRPGMLDTEKSRAKAHWRENGVRGKDISQLIQHFYHLPDDILIENIVIESLAYAK